MKSAPSSTDLITAADNNEEWMAADLADEDTPRIVWTHTYYGRDGAPDNASQMGNVILAYRYAAKVGGDARLMMMADEDCGIAVEGISDMEFAHDMAIGWVTSEQEALAFWWNLYARFDAEENVPGLREAVAAYTGREDLLDYEG